MAHGSEDWKQSKPVATIYTLDDMGELAVRLGSPVSFDRRGNVVWFDDFESGLKKWEAYASGPGHAVAISSEAARNGAFSAKLTTGNIIDSVAQIIHYLPYPTEAKVGFEISFSSNDDMSEIRLWQVLYDGSYEHDARIRYLPSTDKLQYYDENGAWQDLATDLVLSPEYDIFCTIKLVIDLSTHKYVRAILNAVEYDMSAFSYFYGAFPTAPHWEQGIWAETAVASNQSFYVDDAIVTQNEP